MSSDSNGIELLNVNLSKHMFAYGGEIFYVTARLLNLRLTFGTTSILGYEASL